MGRIKLIILVLFLCFISSCSLVPTSPPNWELEKNGLVLHLRSDNKLNVDKGKAYTLYLVIYQLSNPNSFNHLIEDADGLTKLLESKIFDPDVAAVKSIVIYPGTDVRYKIDRAEGARYIGLVAGYRTLTKERIVRVYEVPVEVKIDNILKLSQKLVPQTLDIKLRLGPRRIEEFTDNT